MATGRAANFYTHNTNMYQYTLLTGTSAASPITVSNLAANDILLSCVEFALPALDTDGWKVNQVAGVGTLATITLTGYVPSTDTINEVWEQDGTSGQLTLVTSSVTLTTVGSFKLDRDTTGDSLIVRWYDVSEVEQPAVTDRTAVASFTDGYLTVSVDTTGSKLALTYLDISASEL